MKVNVCAKTILYLFMLSFLISSCGSDNDSQVTSNNQEIPSPDETIGGNQTVNSKNNSINDNNVADKEASTTTLQIGNDGSNTLNEEIDKKKVEKIEGWAVGLRWSEIKNRVTDEVKMNRIFERYVLIFPDITVELSEKGVVDSVVTEEQGIGLSLGLVVGDKESEVEEYLGQTEEQVFMDFMHYGYQLEGYTLNVLCKEGKVVNINLQLNDIPNFDESKEIAEFFLRFQNSEEIDPHEGDLLMEGIKEEEMLTVDQLTVTELLNIFDIVKQDMKRFAEIYQLDENEQECNT